MDLRRWLDAAPPWRWALLGLLVCLPSLNLGLLADDHLLRANLSGDARLPELRSSAWDAFHFFPPMAQGLAGIDQGFSVWWAAPHGVARALRPLASLSHWVDFQLWPDQAWLMHLESALWYAALCAIAAALYRQLLSGWAAGLAALFFALDYTHGMTVAWVANRNALMAGVFGLGALLLHRRARSGESPAWAAGAALLLAGALASGEVGLGAAAYLLAHALCLEAPGKRLRSLIPYALVGAGWAAIYLLGHFGVRGSGLYLTPGSGAFLRKLPAHLLLLLGSELGSAGADLWPLVGSGPRAAMLLLAVGAVGLAGLALRPLLRRDANARFLAVGAVLSALPLCATFPSARLSLVPGFGLVGLVALACVEWREAKRPLPSRWLAPFAVIAGVLHLVVAPPLFLVIGRTTAGVQRIVASLVRGLPDTPALTSQHLVLVNPPDLLFTMYLRPTLASQGASRAVPRGAYVLGLGTHALEVTRVDERTLTVRDDAGLYGQDFSMLFRPEGSPLPVGTRIATPTVTAEVRATTSEGTPTEVAFRFGAPLEDPTLRWLQWSGDSLEPFALPAPGEKVLLPARPHPLLRGP